MVSEVDIGGRKVGAGHPCFLMAEAGVNHNGDIRLARQLVDVAAAAGVDAVKFQTFIAESLISPVAEKADYQRATTGAGESQLDLVKKLELSFDSFRDLYAYCRRKKVMFLSTPFDEASVDFLDELGVMAFKISSGEVTNLPFLAYVARKGKPVILSTGMSTLGEVEAAVQTVQAEGSTQLMLLHCVSNYPAAPENVNLRAMRTLSAAFGVPVGYSDHTLGNEVALAAVARGACLIEKHFTLDRKLPGPDHQASSEPAELRALVEGVRKVEASLGDGLKKPADSERGIADVARRSVVAACDMAIGTVVTADMLVNKRPGNGLPPVMRTYLLGRSTRVAIRAGELVRLDMFI